MRVDCGFVFKTCFNLLLHGGRQDRLRRWACWSRQFVESRFADCMPVGFQVALSRLRFADPSVGGRGEVHDRPIRGRSAVAEGGRVSRSTALDALIVIIRGWAQREGPNCRAVG